MGATANLETKALNVEPGAEANVRIRIQNTGQVVDEFSIEVLGDPAPWATVNPPTVPLFPGKDAIATITFRPPRTPQTTAGQMHFGVRVQSREDPAGSVVEEGTLAVGTYAESSAELVPKNSRGSRTGVHQLALDNRGNGSMRAALSAGDQDKLLEFSFSPASLVVAPGTAGFARLRVRPRQTFWRGSPKSKAFKVLVQPEGQLPINLDGSMVQGPLLAPWMIPVALGVVALLIAGALLWFLAVKPGIESVARNAVATPSPQGGGGGGGGGGKASPSAGPSVAPTSGAASANFSTRLQGGVTQYKVPPATTLYITDIVFQDPESSPGTAKGTVTLARDGIALLVENLDNFRDLDYHFVTPITLNAGQTLSMVVNCPSGCPAASIYANGYLKGT